LDININNLSSEELDKLNDLIMQKKTENYEKNLITKMSDKYYDEITNICDKIERDLHPFVEPMRKFSLEVHNTDYFVIEIVKHILLNVYSV
jgi:hypothetical protein